MVGGQAALNHTVPVTWLQAPSSSHALLEPALEHNTFPQTLIFRQIIDGLTSGQRPLVVTAVGQSNTVWWSGCFGAGCIPTSGRPIASDGWGASFLRLVNNTWPHQGHAFHNRAYGASSPKAIATCLGVREPDLTRAKPCQR